MSNKSKRKNLLFGKPYTESSIELIKQKSLNRKHLLNIKLKLSAIRVNLVNIYENFLLKD